LKYQQSKLSQVKPVLIAELRKRKAWQTDGTHVGVVVKNHAMLRVRK